MYVSLPEVDCMFGHDIFAWNFTVVFHPSRLNETVCCRQVVVLNSIILILPYCTVNYQNKVPSNWFDPLFFNWCDPFLRGQILAISVQSPFVWHPPYKKYYFDFFTVVFDIWCYSIYSLWLYLKSKFCSPFFYDFMGIFYYYPCATFYLLAGINFNLRKPLKC